MVNMPCPCKPVWCDGDDQGRNTSISAPISLPGQEDAKTNKHTNKQYLVFGLTEVSKPTSHPRTIHTIAPGGNAADPRWKWSQDLALKSSFMACWPTQQNPLQVSSNGYNYESQKVTGTVQLEKKMSREWKFCLVFFTISSLMARSVPRT